MEIRVIKKMKKNIKIVYLTAFCIFFVGIIAYILLNGVGNTKNKKVGDKAEVNQIEFYKNYIDSNEAVIKGMVKYRSVLVDKNSKKILIGKSQKELENNYFDISISSVNNSTAVVNINKLFKDLSLCKVTSNLDEEYLDESLRLINKIFDLELNQQNQEELKKHVKEAYISIRAVQNVDNPQLRDKVVNFTISKYDMSLDIIDNMVALKIDFGKVGVVI